MIMKKKSFWQILWNVSKPILTFGLSLLIPILCKNMGPEAPVVGGVAQEAGEALINAADDAINNIDTPSIQIPDSVNKKSFQN